MVSPFGAQNAWHWATNQSFAQPRLMAMKLGPIRNQYYVNICDNLINAYDKILDFDSVCVSSEMNPDSAKVQELYLQI